MAHPAANENAAPRVSGSVPATRKGKDAMTGETVHLPWCNGYSCMCGPPKTDDGRALGYRCAAHRGGCTNRVAHPLEVCRTCKQEAQEDIEDHLYGPPDDFQKDWTLSEHGYGQEDYHDGFASPPRPVLPVGDTEPGDAK